MLNSERCQQAPCQRQIGGAASECLRSSQHRFLRTIICECDQGTLTLRGKVSSFYRKQLAQEAVARITGAMRVVNEIEVCES